MPLPTRSGHPLPDGYAQVLEDLKHRIREAQVRAHRVVNTELVGLYWSIGKTILERQGAQGWGAKVIEQLSADLTREFPSSKGFSRSNLEYMRRFAGGWPVAFPQQPVGEMPWGHITVLLDKLDDQELRDWYAGEASRYGWSRAVLLNQVKSQLHLRAGAAPSNFANAPPSPDSELVQQMVKDPYNFEFLGLTGAVAERELEDALVSQVSQFLLELGHGFAFVGRQVHFDVDGDDFYVDLLLYNIPLHRYVVIELKIDKFRPEHAGQLNMYVNMVDDMRRGDGDNPTIGILLCANRNERVVGYALGGTTAPMAVAGYEMLPGEVKDALPAAGDLAEVLEHPVVGGVQRTLSEYIDQLEDERDRSAAGLGLTEALEADRRAERDR